ncbi:Reticulocyte-binding protein a [Spatholobus suberectus]|nr:Reticulocyte-binding protein a [Spatholobus suberectus]
MEATAAVAAAAAVRGTSLQMPPPSRKEWRAVAEHHHSARNPDDEELDNAKLGQSDERTIYEQGREPLDVDFCSITVDGTLDNDILQQQLHSVVRQRQELLQMEIELKAQMIARTEIMEMRNTFDAQLKEHANNADELQEQLCERECTIHELERKMEEKDRELHAIKLDNEAAWAKQDLLHEQNKELATFRMERDHSEAERAQHIKQIHDLQEHIQEKDRQLIELQEQHRVAQETIMFKDEQLREAQAWIARVREMDVFQSTTNQTLQAELRERTEQYNQLWMGFQRQFAEMERVHLHAIQQLQLELADARERSGTYNDDSRMSQMNSKNNVTQFGQENGSQFDLNGGNASGGNNGLLPNESTDNSPPFASTGNASIETDHVPGVPIAPSSLLVPPSYLPHGQVTALHPFVMHQQGVPNSVASHVPQSHVGHFHPVPSMSPMQQWQNQQSVSEGSQVPIQEHPSPSQTDQNLMRSDAKFSYEMSVNGQTLHRDYLDAHIQQGEEPQTLISSATSETQVLPSVDKGQLVASQQDQSMQQISSQFSDALRLNSFEPNGEIKEQNFVTLSNDGPEDQVLLAEQASSAANASSVTSHSVNHNEMIQNNSTDSVLSEAFTSTGPTASTTIAKTSETALLDEKSLLACIVRTIPAGGRIRISSTLPNRLGKMLAPLHWHDYKRKYGKLDDFVASHPELFLIEGDYIQLRDGAQKMVAANAAVAKVAAAAAASTPYSSYMSTVAVTPMAQSHRLKKAPSIDSKNIKSDKTLQEYAVISSNTGDDPLKLSVMQHQQSNGACFSVAGGLSSVKILSKSKDSREMDGPESRVVQSSVQLSVGNGGSIDRSSMSSAQISGSANGRLVSSFASKQQTRATGAVYPSRR